MIRTNFHTHTTRCLHAQGSDEQYVRAAIDAGLDEMGFSDHIPWPYEDDYVSFCRMPADQLDGYLRSVTALKMQYAGDIRIALGLESEYYPEFLGWLQDIRELPELEYMIYGCHFDRPEEIVYFGQVSSPAHLKRYADRAIMGITSGMFDCFAHPDLFLQGVPRFDAECLSISRDLCRAAREYGIPIEYNLSGLYHPRDHAQTLGYPCFEFWEVAAMEGVSAIISLDAHAPERLTNIPAYDTAAQTLRAFGIPRVVSLAPGRAGNAEIA